jgi:hypothetical protein
MRKAGKNPAQKSSDKFRRKPCCFRAVFPTPPGTGGGVKLAVLLGNIIGQKRVRSRYLVGMYFQKMAVWAKRILPASMLEKLIISHYKI